MAAKPHYVVIVTSANEHGGGALSVHGHWYNYPAAVAYSAQLARTLGDKTGTCVAIIRPATVQAAKEIHP